MLKTHHSAKSQGCKQRGGNWVRTSRSERKTEEKKRWPLYERSGAVWEPQGRGREL